MIKILDLVAEAGVNKACAICTYHGFFRSGLLTMPTWTVGHLQAALRLHLLFTITGSKHDISSTSLCFFCVRGGVGEELNVE